MNYLALTGLLAQALTLFDGAFLSRTLQLTASTTPASVSGLRLWLKPESLSGANGTGISTWADSSGNSWSPTNTTSASMPYITNNVLNGYQGLYFDGGDWLKCPGAANGLARNVTGCTIVGVVKRDSGTTSRAFFTIERNAAGSSRFYAYVDIANQIQAGGRRLDSDSFAGFGSTYAMGAGFFWQVAVADYSNAKGFLYYNGTSAHTNASWQTSGSTSDTDSNALTVGAFSNVAEPWVGVIVEIAVYNRALSASDVATLDEYFTAKYGL